MIEERLRRHIEALASPIECCEVTEAESVFTEHRLHATVRDVPLDDAARAPRLPQTWGTPTNRSRPIGGRRRNPLRYAALAGAAAVIIVALAALASRSTIDRVSPATSWHPPGTEFPSQDLGVPTATRNLTLSGLARSIRVDGQPDLTISTELTYRGGRTAELQRCLSSGGGAGCTPEWNAAPLGSLGNTRSVSDSVEHPVAYYELWTWDGIPTSAAFVVYGNPNQQQWQQPIAGVAAFPYQPGVTGAVAYDANGREVSRIDQDLAYAAAHDVREPEQADINHDQLAQLQQLTATTLHDCLTADGATITGNIADTTTDVWDRCVNRTKTTVTNAVDALHPRFYDPTTERPTNSDPIVVYGS